MPDAAHHRKATQHQNLFRLHQVQNPNAVEVETPTTGGCVVATKK